MAMTDTITGGVPAGWLSRGVCTSDILCHSVHGRQPPRYVALLTADYALIRFEIVAGLIVRIDIRPTSPRSS
jgi:hypothetical protein